MKATAIKANWASKLMRSKSFVVITDTESVIFSEKTNPKTFNDYMTAHNQLSALTRFQTAINKTVKDFQEGAAKKFGPTDANGKPRTRKINVTEVK